MNKKYKYFNISRHSLILFLKPSRFTNCVSLHSGAAQVEGSLTPMLDREHNHCGQKEQL